MPLFGDAYAGENEPQLMQATSKINHDKRFKWSIVKLFSNKTSCGKFTTWKYSYNAPLKTYLSYDFPPPSSSMTVLLGGKLEWGKGVANYALFVGDLMCTLLVKAFCPHSPKPRKSTALEMIKISPSMSWYYHLTPALRLRPAIIRITGVSWEERYCLKVAWINTWRNI